ncbi:MAG: TonB-dependent receptor [Pseudomonadales bacterium]
MKHRYQSISVALLYLTYIAFTAQLSYAEEPLSEIVVTSELLEQNPLELPLSVSIIDSAQIELRSAQHIEDLLNLAPNVNFSSGASRGRFIQIRGIGERSEFQEPIINSVGVLIDGIDMTGVATGATTLDVQQVEILRGPQGTLFGANALAGMINIVSNAPSDELSAAFGVLGEEHGGFGWDGVVSGPITQTSGYRLAVKQYQSNGFIDNVFLDRDNTNNIDETSARLRFVTHISDRVTLDVTSFYADVDNGYDAFSLDNSRQTYSDQPGEDKQETLAFGAKISAELSDGLALEGLISTAGSELLYSYDEDWSHPGICDDLDCDSTLAGFDWFYVSTDRLQRDNENTSLDLRLLNTRSETFEWVLGLYYRDQSIDLDRIYTFADADFGSAFDTTNTAFYTQVDIHLDERWSLSTGLRLEQRDVNYDDSNNESLSTNEDLWGGKLAIEYHADSGAFYYGLISRGYKPGGFNLGDDIEPTLREFDTETMLNYELGVKRSLLDGALQLQLAVFYQDRDDVQTKQSIVRSIASGEQGGLCPCSFTDLTDNATSGSNKGVELELNWAIGEYLEVFAVLGILDTEFDEFLTFQHLNADLDNGVPFNLVGRDQAHAPNYQLAVGGQYKFARGWHLSGSVEAKDEFYFSDRHDAKSDSYRLLNLELGYSTARWQVALYGKNINDELVKTRGFGSFGNDPRKFYELEPYNQFAAPRLVGLKARMNF